MEKRTHNFLKGLGILFAVAAGIGTAVLGYVDRTDWIQVAFYSVAVVAIVLWGWHFFLSDGLINLKLAILKKPKMMKAQVKEAFFGI